MKGMRQYFTEKNAMALFCGAVAVTTAFIAMDKETSVAERAIAITTMIAPTFIMIAQFRKDICDKAALLSLAAIITLVGIACFREDISTFATDFLAYTPEIAVDAIDPALVEKIVS